jgi:cytochrome P450
MNGMHDVAIKNKSRPGIFLISPDVQKDPFPVYEKMRAEFPVCQVEPDGIWAITRYADALAALKDATLFSSAATRTLYQPEWLDAQCHLDYSILSEDPPEHDVHRRFINKAFVGKVINALIPMMEETAQSLLANIRGPKQVDFHRDFADQYIGKILRYITGTEDIQTIAELRHWVNLTEQVTPARPDDARVSALEAAIRKQRDYFYAVIAERRARPRCDLISELIQNDTDGQQLTDRMIVSLLELLLAAGFLTSTNMLSHSIMRLAREPALFQQLKSDASLIPAFIEEILRFDAPTQCVLRQTTQAVTIRDITIPKNALVLIIVASANRDAEYFENPDRFMLNRANVREHIAFGHGVHTCIGAALARLETKIALSAIISEFSQVACPPDDELPWISALWSHAVSELPVIFS